MKKTHLGDMVALHSGTPQFRITELAEPSAPVYDYYGQAELEADFWQVDTPTPTGKQIRTADTVALTAVGDVLFSLISGKAVQVQAVNSGRLYTQNYVKLIPNADLDALFLVYLLNENADIARQFGLGLQGSQVFKYTVKQLKELVLPTLPSLDIQRLIGDSYQKSKRLATLKRQLADNEHRLILAQLHQHGAK